MIEGYVEGRRPYVAVAVSFPRRDRAGIVQFLVDTASDTSIVLPRDALRLGFDFDRDFTASRLVASVGTGGSSGEYVEGGLLTFTHHDLTLESIGMQISIAVPTAFNQGFPSILGLDMLSYFRLTLETRAGLVRLDEADPIGG